jgi:hypothetical protein
VLQDLRAKLKESSAHTCAKTALENIGGTWCDAWHCPLCPYRHEVSAPQLYASALGGGRGAHVASRDAQ